MSRSLVGVAAALLALFVVVAFGLALQRVYEHRIEPWPGSGVGASFWHDDAHGVGCWMARGGGISCLPDATYRRVEP
jgi:hypothetical protein